MYISVVKASDNGYYIVCNREEMCLLGFESLDNGLLYYENAYNRKHRRSYEGSMSACLNYMFCQASIVKAPDMEEIRRLVGDKPKPYNLHHISGSMIGLKLPDEYGKRLWEAGEKPKLIDREQL
jgi:hypothetical protein